MSDTGLKDSVDSLATNLSTLADSVGDLDKTVKVQTTNAKELADQVREGNNERRKTAKIIRRLAYLMYAKLATLVLLAIVVFTSLGAQSAIKDCTTPGGKCAQRSAASTAEAVNSLAYKGEQQRLLTELPISEQKNDGIRVEQTKSRLAQLDKLITDSAKRLSDIQAGRITPATTGVPK